MPLPQIYQKYGEGAIASYDYTDIDEGVGYVIFTAFTSSPAGTLTYRLSKEVMETGNLDPTSVDSHNRRFFTNATATIATFTSSPLNFPKIIEGKVYVVFTLAATNGNSGSGIPTMALYHNTTEVGSTAGTTCSGVSKIITYNLSFDVAKTKIKAGDTLSLKFFATETGDMNIFLLHDPLNRDVSTYTSLSAGVVPNVTASTNQSKLNVYIPFKIDL